MIQLPDGGQGMTPGERAAMFNKAPQAQQFTQVNAGAAQMAGGAQAFKAAAGTGFHVTPDGAAILIKSCMDALDEVARIDRHIHTVSQEPKLGQTPGANVIAPFTARVATDEQGMRPAITSLRQTLNDMIDAYRKASTNYQETEAIIARSMQQKPPQA